MIQRRHLDTMLIYLMMLTLQVMIQIVRIKTEYGNRFGIISISKARINLVEHMLYGAQELQIIILFSLNGKEFAIERSICDSGV